MNKYNARDTITVCQILSPLGEHPHTKGLQLVDEISFKEMYKKMHSWWGKNPIPVYNAAHPDDRYKPSDKRCTSAVVGYVKEMFMDSWNINVLIEYNKKLINKNLKKKNLLLSPRWETTRIKKEHKVLFRPTNLISLSITNNPNIEESGYILSSFNTDSL